MGRFDCTSCGASDPEQFCTFCYGCESCCLDGKDHMIDAYPGGHFELDEFDESGAD
jgi:hypothetical protein